MNISHKFVLYKIPSGYDIESYHRDEILEMYNPHPVLWVKVSHAPPRIRPFNGMFQSTLR